MDKRILRTKKKLKNALISLLEKKNFETITATEICDMAGISRNTFYNYYGDKYALLEDCFQDYEDTCIRHFTELQAENNPDDDMEKSFLNLVNTFLDNEDLKGSIPIFSSFDLVALYYHAIMNILEKYEDRYSRYMNPDYDLKQLNSFLALGFWGFIHGNEKLDSNTIREHTQKLLLDLLKSPVFIDRIE